MDAIVIRAVYWDGAPQPVGTLLALTPRQFAELRAAGKVEAAPGETPPPASALTTDTAGDLVPGARRKGAMP